MNTNIIALLVLSAATNWTGINHEGREPGLITTNHIAQVVYQGKTNEFKLLSEPSDRVVWRDWFYMERLLWLPERGVWTNRYRPGTNATEWFIELEPAKEP